MDVGGNSSGWGCAEIGGCGGKEYGRVVAGVGGGDEATGALDTRSGEQVMSLFQQLNEEGVTIVMITHESEIANHAHRIVTIRDGRLMQGRFTGADEKQEGEVL